VAFDNASELHVHPKVGQFLAHHGNDSYPWHYCVCRQPGGAAFDITGATVLVTLQQVERRAADVSMYGTMYSAAAGEFYFQVSAVNATEMRPPGTWKAGVKLTSGSDEVTQTNEMLLYHMYGP
jgi:hypothetical protein